MGGYSAYIGRPKLASREAPFSDRLLRLGGSVRHMHVRPLIGSIKRITGALIEASLPSARIGDLCLLAEPGARVATQRYAEVVGLRDGAALLSVLGEVGGLSQNTQVVATGAPLVVPTGEALLGRVLDGLGAPLDLDTHGPIERADMRPVDAKPPHALSRAPIGAALPLGIPSIDALMTTGEGQRVGIFGGPGLGKSTLLSAIAKAASADVAVIALVGERGREVAEFIEDALGPEGLAKSVVIAATSDRPSMERLKAPFVATAIAEQFRDEGKRVVLLMDSLTRLARAQREIGLAAGEPPARRAFPPSVFSLLPRLIERAGMSASGGSITAFYTVLVEDDGVGDPVAEEARALLDGHIILSPKIAASGRYPAIDVLSSRSRVMGRVVSDSHRRAAERARALLARYDELELLVRLGEHRTGIDGFADEAIEKKAMFDRFLFHSLSEPSDWNATVDALVRLAGSEGAG